MAKHTKITIGKQSATARVVERYPTPTGGEELIVRTQAGHTKRMVTSPSSVASMDRAVKLYKRALKSLADK
jgi:hypothetical protein